MKRRVGFVEQDDIVIPDLTVRQMLAFTAELRLPYSMSRQDKKTRIEGVVTAMRLGKTMETKIANISGGERKRVCIALELVASPEVLLMDEPTSGLDSTVAYKVVNYVKEVIHSRGTSVIMTIHQPNQAIYDLIDDLILMDGSGRVVYRGEARLAKEYFSRRLNLVAPANYSTADLLLDLVVNDKLGSDQVRSILAEDFQGCRRVGDCLPEGRSSSSLSSSSPSPSPTSSPFEGQRTGEATRHSRFATPWWNQIRVLLQRDFTATWRSELEASNLLLQIGFAVLTAILFIQLPVTQSSVFMRSALCFWFCAAFTFFSFFGNLRLFAAKEKVAEKELSLNAYSL